MTDTPPKSPKPRGRRRTAAQDARLCERFLVALGKGTTLAGASRKVGLPYRTLMDWLDKDHPSYKAEFDAAVNLAAKQSREAVVADLADVGRKRTRKTYRIDPATGEKKLWQIDEAPDTAALARVADYMDDRAQRVELTGANGGPLQTQALTGEAAELRALELINSIMQALTIKGGKVEAVTIEDKSNG
jgi:lambda repressor-like predicted transcriptional regulator